MPTFRDSLSPFSVPTFRAMWMSNLSSNFGTLIQSVGAAWLMTSLTTEADLVALVQSSMTLPIMLFSVVAGALADNFDRRRIMLVAQVFMLCVAAILAATAYAGLITPWLLLSLTFLLGCGTALNNPSWQASVGDMVPRSDLPAAVALNSIGINITRSVGPAVGGAIVAIAGAAAAFAVNALSFLPVILAILRWTPNQPRSPLPPEALRAAVAAGIRYVAMSPNIGKVLLRAFAFGFGAIAIQALLPLVARDLLGGGALTYGLLLGAFGVGAICGGFLGNILRGRLTGEAIVRSAFVGFAAAASVAAASPFVLVTGLALMVAGCSFVLTLSRLNVTVQLASPRWVVGRALSLYQTCNFGGMAVGSWIWGLIAEQHGVSTALYVSAAALAFGAALGLRFAIPEDATLSLDPLNRFREPHVALDLTPRSGPILVMLEFDIDVENTEAFLEAMAERRRIRRRDGAQNWALSRDLEDPTLWIESYHAPTWTEYVRHNQRATFADAAIRDRLHALNRSGGPPRVRRLIERPTRWTELSAASFKTGNEFH